MERIESVSKTIDVYCQSWSLILQSRIVQLLLEGRPPIIDIPTDAKERQNVAYFL